MIECRILPKSGPNLSASIYPATRTPSPNTETTVYSATARGNSILAARQELANCAGLNSIGVTGQVKKGCVNEKKNATRKLVKVINLGFDPINPCALTFEMKHRFFLLTGKRHLKPSSFQHQNKHSSRICPFSLACPLKVTVTWSGTPATC